MLLLLCWCKSWVVGRESWEPRNLDPLAEIVYLQEIVFKLLLFAVMWKKTNVKIWKKLRTQSIQIRNASWMWLCLLGQFKCTAIREMQSVPLWFNAFNAWKELQEDISWHLKRFWFQVPVIWHSRIKSLKFCSILTAKITCEICESPDAPQMYTHKTSFYRCYGLQSNEKYIESRL